MNATIITKPQIVNVPTCAYCEINKSNPAIGIVYPICRVCYDKQRDLHNAEILAEGRMQCR